MIQNLSGEKLYAVVLAAGNGTKLQKLAAERFGSSLPKQYLPVIAGRSLLEATWARIEHLVPRKKILTVIAQRHLRQLDIMRQLSSRPVDSILAQPENKDTAAALLFSLLHVTHRFPDAIIAVFPCCHYVRQDAWFMRYVRLAAQAIEINPDQIVLLGIAPRQAESDYDYLVAHDVIQQPCAVDLYRLTRFIDKPPLRDAQEIVAAGGFCNTQVMVFRGAIVLRLIEETLPEFYQAFEPLRPALGTTDEKEAAEQVYGALPSVSFTRDFLQHLVLSHSAVTVLPVRNVLWSDWGIPERIISFLDQHRHVPANGDQDPRAPSQRVSERGAREKHEPAIPV